MDWEVNVGKGLLHLDCVVAQSEVTSPQEAFARVAQALQSAHGIAAASLVERLCLREGKGSTAMGHGFALPHAATWGLTSPHAAYLRSARPIAFFHTSDNLPVHDMLVLVVPRPATALHHAMLQHYEAMLARPDFRAQLVEAQDAPGIWRLFREHEWDREPRPRKAVRRPAKLLLTPR